MLVLLAAVVLAVIAGTLEGRTRSALAASGPTPSQEVGIVALGDFGVGGEQQRKTGAAVRRFAAQNPVHFFMTLGDNHYRRTREKFATNWLESFGWLAEEGVVVSGVLGNHDHEAEPGARYQFDLLNMPHAYYTRRMGAADVLLLDSTDISRTQTAWLERQLAASTAPWKIVAHHHPAFTCGNHSSDEDVMREWVPIFEEHGVDLVLTASEHSYQRFAPRRGVTYVVSGGGGAQLYELDPTCPAEFPPRMVARSAHHFLHLLVTPATIRIRAVALDGTNVDSLELLGPGARAAERAGLTSGLGAAAPVLIGGLILAAALAAAAFVTRRHDVAVLAAAVLTASVLAFAITLLA